MSTESTVRLFHLPFSFMLPQKVAAERSYFADEGLSVEFVERDRTDVDRKYIPADETLTGDHNIDMYPICKWESLKRTWEMDDGRIIAKGTFADLPYSVFVHPDADIDDPGDLAGVSVGVNIRTGQEYTARKALEEHIEPEDINIVHEGMPTDRLRALQNGTVDAVTLLDPQSTLARELGFEELFQYENHMGIVGRISIDRETRDAFLRAYERAVQDINANPETFRDKYVEMLTTEAATDVAPELFESVDMESIRQNISLPRYETPDIADREELDDHLAWMKTRGLIDVDADIDNIVAQL